MSAPEGFRPPDKTYTKAIYQAAGKVARLKQRMRTQRKKLEALDVELHEAQRVLRSLIADLTSPADPIRLVDREQAEELIDRAVDGR